MLSFRAVFERIISLSGPGFLRDVVVVRCDRVGLPPPPSTRWHAHDALQVSMPMTRYRLACLCPFTGQHAHDALQIGMFMPVYRLACS